MLWKLFIVFTRVAFFSWGGGPASLALMQRETMSVGWVTASEFADAVAIGNALPGPIAPQVSAYIGYKMAGIPGAILAVTGTVIPTTLLMLVMVIFFYGIKDSPTVSSMLAAVRPVVIGFLLWTAYVMAQSVLSAAKLGWGPALAKGWDKVIIALVAFAVLVLTKVNPIFLILAAAVFGLLVYR